MPLEPVSLWIEAPVSRPALRLPFSLLAKFKATYQCCVSPPSWAAPCQNSPQTFSGLHTGDKLYGLLLPMAKWFVPTQI